MIQKIIRIGNSAGITIPKEYLEAIRSKIGSKVQVKLDSDVGHIIVDVPQKTKKQATRPVAKEFQQWLDTFVEEDKDLLNELADR